MIIPKQLCCCLSVCWRRSVCCVTLFLLLFCYNQIHHAVTGSILITSGGSALSGGKVLQNWNKDVKSSYKWTSPPDPQGNYLEKVKDEGFTDREGCNAIDNVNYLIYSQTFEPDACAQQFKILLVLLSSERRNETSSIHVGYVEAAQVDSLAVHMASNEEVSWGYIDNNFKAINSMKISKTKESELVLMAAENFSVFNPYQVVIKLQHVCTQVTFNTFSNEQASSLEVKNRSCPELSSNLAHYPKICWGTTPKQIFDVEGECVENAVLVSPDGRRPTVQCVSGVSNFVKSLSQTKKCQCKPGFEPRTDFVTCEPCKENYFKPSIGNSQCEKCPEGSHSIRGYTQSVQCKCNDQHFRIIGDIGAPHSPCYKPYKMQDFNLATNYNLVNISLSQHEFSETHPSYSVFISRASDTEVRAVNPEVTLTHNSPTLFLRDLPPNERMVLFVCDGRDFIFNNQDRSASYSTSSQRKNYACSQKSFRTHGEVSIKNLIVNLDSTSQGSQKIIELVYTWEVSSIVRNDQTNQFKYSIKIAHNDVVIQTIPHRTTYNIDEGRYRVFEEGQYRVEVELIQSDVVIYSLSSNSIHVSNQNMPMNGKMVTLLIGVVALILIILFIVFLLAVLFLRTKKSAVPKHMLPYGTNNPNLPFSATAANATYLSNVSPNLFKFAPNSFQDLTRYSSCHSGIGVGTGLGMVMPPPPTSRFLEPETELYPYLESQGKNFSDLFEMLQIVSIPLLELETQQLPPIHMLLLQGEMGVCKVRMKDSPNGDSVEKERQPWFDLKLARNGSEQVTSNLLTEAIILSQLKHNHVVLMHGIVEYGTNGNNLALLLEDCGTITLLQYLNGHLASSSSGGDMVSGKIYDNSGSIISDHNNSTIYRNCSQHTNSPKREEVASSGLTQPGLSEKLQHLRCIASALEHFTEIHYFHKVLCAENILINPNGVCRVAGFEDRVLIDKNQMELPSSYFRYWPPEVIKAKCFSLKSDIWSFGVLIWQSFNTATQPFQNYSDSQVKMMVLEGHSLPPNASDTMPPLLSDLMKACFVYNSINRPTAYDIKDAIHKMLFPNNNNHHTSVEFNDIGIADDMWDDSRPASGDLYRINAPHNTMLNFLLQHKLPVAYQKVFNANGIYDVDEMQWNDTFLKKIGIADKKHRRKMIVEGNKLCDKKSQYIGSCV